MEMAPTPTLGHGLDQSGGLEHREVLHNSPSSHVRGLLRELSGRQTRAIRNQPQQTATRLTKVAFTLIISPRQARSVIAVEQTGPIAPTDPGEVTAKRLSLNLSQFVEDRRWCP